MDNAFLGPLVSALGRSFHRSVIEGSLQVKRIYIGWDFCWLPLGDFSLRVLWR